MVNVYRHIHESFQIGNFFVFVDSILQNKVRLIIGTPNGVPIHRKESYQVLYQDQDKTQRETENLRPCNTSPNKDLTYDAIVREENEAIMIGDQVMIKVDHIGNDDTQFGVFAPNDCEVKLLK